MHTDQLIIDADMTPHGWEIVLRADAESQEAAWSGIQDADLPEAVGATIAHKLITFRDAQERTTA